ncbi:MAG: TRAP transporter substrate-binding protein DctP [Gracilibacteraceae bacterium]|jgi:TRAP-type C4-dicarboxylate transport system substrate-binding protein|nr:TRAP transporter substrate-binding protein DctP [Gracilibacteraceae bacterium]
MKKKAASLLLCTLLLLALLLSACSAPPQQAPPAQPGNTETEAEGEGTAPEGEATAATPVELRIHCDYTEDHPTGLLLAEFIERVKNDSGGTVIIKPYYSGVLGDYTTVFDEVAQGTIDMTFGAPSVSYGEKYNMVVFPYIASSWNSAADIYAKGKFIYESYEQMCADINIKLLTLHVVGAGGLASAKMPVNWEQWGVPHDILLRVPNTALFSVVMKEMGYNCQSVNWSELFTSMQTGVIDAFVGGHPPACYDQFRDVIKYYIQINNFFEVSTISVNLDTFNRLTPEQQNALTVNADWVFEQSLERGESVEAEYLQKMRDYGIEVIVPEQAVLDEFAAKCREIVWPQLKDVIGEELYDGLVAASASA